MEFSILTAISPLDGRYYAKLAELRPIVSEYGLMYYRLIVEIRWLQTLIEEKIVPDLIKLEAADYEFLEQLITGFDLNAAEQIKVIEQTTNHDVKAIEYYLQNQLAHHPKLSELIPFIHFGCTSEDINNLAYSLMLLESRQKILQPNMQALIDKLVMISTEYADLPMLTRTHGQPASPSTLGKEIINVVIRLQRQFDSLLQMSILGKFNGAVGNYNAHQITCPQTDWIQITKKFIENFGFTCNLYTTQIEPHDNLAEFLQNLMRFNTILIDLNRDLWGYISLGYFKQLKVKDEVGSSTMPHKVNPIDFENSEGNLGVANALADHLANKLPTSRWQRDLTDSTVLRNFGSIIGYSAIAYQSTFKGLNKLQVNEIEIQQELNQHWELLAEAIQTVLRYYGISDAYERLKDLTRGQNIDAQLLIKFIEQLPLSAEVKEQLKSLSPANYLGYAKELTQRALKEINENKGKKNA